MLLYLVKHSWPDLSNGTQELSKVMDKAMEGHMKELCRVIKYALDTRTIGLKLKPDDNDSDIFTKNTTSEIHHRHSEKLIWTKEEYELEASRITTGRVLRGIVNHSNGKSLVDSDRNTKDNRLSGTNRYEVLENYAEVENVEIGTKSTT